MTRKEYELATALQALLMAVSTNDDNGEVKDANQIYSEAGFQAAAALINNCGLDTWHDEITI